MRKVSPMEVICQGCGTKFKRQNGKINRKYCTLKCAYEHRNKNGEFIRCPICDGIFYKARKTSKYCSVECRHIGTRKRVIKHCDFCGKEVSRPASYHKWQRLRGHKNFYCSISCSSKAQPKGEKHPHWKGGISRAYKYGYHSPEYKKWRDSVFIRDNFTCQICNKKGGYLHAHHIKSFSHFPSSRFQISNGITLCKDCHNEVHSRKSRKTPKNKLGISLQNEAMKDLKRKGKARLLEELRRAA